MSFQNCKVYKINADSAEYLSPENKGKRGEVSFVMSSGSLRDFAECASRWIAGYEEDNNGSMKFGSLLDLLALTPGQFDSRYIVQPENYTSEKGEEKPWSNNAKSCKAWNDAQIASGKEIVKKGEVMEAQKAVAKIQEDDILRSFIEASDKQVWVKGEWMDEKTKLVIPVQGLIDLVPRKDTEFAKCLGDLKSTRNAGLRSWQRWCATAGYHVQAAFYLDLYMAAVNPDKNPDGEERNTFCFVVQENFAPYQIARRMMSDMEGTETMLSLGRKFYQSALRKYARCLKTGIWPCYDDTAEAVQGWTPVNPEPWMSYESLSESLQEQTEKSLEESEDVPS
jgi:exodeoxyribonuclease VIII